MISRSSFVKNNLFVFSNRFLSKIITLFLMLFIARSLSPESFGNLTILLTLSSIFALALDLGSSFIVVREIAAMNFDANDVLFSALFTKSIFSIITFGGLIFITYLLGFNKDIINASYIFATGQIFESFLMTVVKYYEGQERMSISSTLQIMERIIIVIAIFCFSNVTSLIHAYGFSYIVSNLVAVFIGIILSRHILNFRKHIKFVIAKKILIFSLPFIIFNFFSVVYNRIDIFIISHYYNEFQVGIYRASFQLIESIYFISLGLNVTLLPLFARKFQNELQDAKLKYSLVSKELFFLGLLITVIIFQNAKSILDILYKGKYSSGNVAFEILSITIPFYFLSNVMGNLLIAIGKEKIQIFSMVISSIFKVIILFILIKIWGIDGAAICVFLAELLSFSIQYWGTIKNGFIIKIIKKDYLKILSLMLYGIIIYYIHNLIFSIILILPVGYFILKDTILFLVPSIRGSK